MHNPDTEFSRQRATAQSLIGKANGDIEHFFELPVLLTGDPQFLKTKNGRWIFEDCAFLLIRMTKRLTIEVRDDETLAAKIRADIAHLTEHQAEVKTTGVDYTQFEAVLSVGAKAEPTLPWTAVNSNGWVARISSGSTDLPVESAQPNPIGALAAACLGVTEAFKRLIQLKPQRGELHDNFAFSFYSYQTSQEPGPPISSFDVGNPLLVGAGAIGNGICQLFRQLPIEGSISVVDPQDFKEENLGTCLLISTQDLDKPKAEVLARLFRARLEAAGYREDVTTFMGTRLGKPIPYPRIILTALDNIDARRQVQTMWPDLVIDGAIGALSCEATLHPWGPDLSCLMCDFEEPTVSATKVQSELTGLRESRLTNLLDFVTEEDVNDAAPEKKDFLAKNIGKQICSVLSEAEIEKIAKEGSKKGFQPSVPFVACLSACMMVTELIRTIAKGPSVLETGYQFDALTGPQNGIRKSHSRKKSCICVDRRSVIEKLRTRR